MDVFAQRNRERKYHVERGMKAHCNETAPGQLQHEGHLQRRGQIAAPGKMWEPPCPARRAAQVENACRNQGHKNCQPKPALFPEHFEEIVMGV